MAYTDSRSDFPPIVGDAVSVVTDELGIETVLTIRYFTDSRKSMQSAGG